MLNYVHMAVRLIADVEFRLLLKLAFNGGYRAARSVQLHKRRLRAGRFFPPFLFISVTNRCNLHCQGCWVDVTGPPHDLAAELLDRTIGVARRAGNSVFGILGGEPFLYPYLFDVLQRHPGCYFLVFTNGQFISPAVAQRMRQLGNISPLVSIEGLERVSGQRRGRPDVWARTMAGLTNCLRHGLVTGVCTSLCKNNLTELLSERWLDRLIDLGVAYVWYYLYRPVGPQPHPELALSGSEQLAVRRFIVRMRWRKPIVILDTYYDHRGQALCPIVTGLSHHISPYGDVEPCPVIQLAADRIDQPCGPRAAIERSEALAALREAIRHSTRGCILLERPELLRRWAEQYRAHDTTLRGTAMAELAAMCPRPSHYWPGCEVPEQSWPYRLAKRLWFSDFGQYEQLRSCERASSPDVLVERVFPAAKAISETTAEHADAARAPCISLTAFERRAGADGGRCR